MLPTPENSIDSKNISLKTERSVSRDIPEIKGYKEKIKTPEEIKIIEFINTRLNNRLKKYGLKKIDVSPEAVHIFDEESYDKIMERFDIKEKQAKEVQLAEKLYSEPFKNNTVAKFIPEYQSILMKDASSLSAFYHRVFHEEVESKLYQKTETTEQGTKVVQLGIALLTEFGEKRFERLKEATIEELNKRDFEEIVFSNPNLPPKLQEELEWTQERKIDLLLKAKEAKDKIEEERIRDTLFVPMPLPFPSGKEKREREMFGSPEGRKLLNSLVGNIYAANKDYKNPTEVIELFFRSLFTGKFEWKEPLEKTFGEGTFKKLGELDKNP